MTSRSAVMDEARSAMRKVSQPALFEDPAGNRASARPLDPDHALAAGLRMMVLECLTRGAELMLASEAVGRLVKRRETTGGALREPLERLGREADELAALTRATSRALARLQRRQPLRARH